MNSKPYMQRLAELWVIQTRLYGARNLNKDEMKEWKFCLDLLAADMYKESFFFNLSLAASMSNDVEWQMDICRRIDNANL